LPTPVSPWSSTVNVTAGGAFEDREHRAHRRAGPAHPAELRELRQRNREPIGAELEAELRLAELEVAPS
jgi:hypothetical protein